MDTENKTGQAARPENISQLVLTFNRAKFEMQIGGSVENYDEALSMLDMARRDFKAKLSAAAVSKVLTAPAGALTPFRMRRGN